MDKSPFQFHGADVRFDHGPDRVPISLTFGYGPRDTGARVTVPVEPESVSEQQVRAVAADIPLKVQEKLRC